MSSPLIERLKSAIEASGKSPQRVSVEATGAKDTVRKILDGTTKSPRVETLRRIGEVLNVSTNYLLGNENDHDGQNTGWPQRPADRDVAPGAAPRIDRLSMPLDIPVMGTAAGSHLRGAFQFEGGVIDYVRRPPGLAGARDIYALFVEGTSMEPQFFPGDLIYVNPHRPPRLGDIVVVQIRDGQHQPNEAMLGIMQKKTPTELVLGKRNPVSELALKRDYIIATHRVLTVNELFGV